MTISQPDIIFSTSTSSKTSQPPVVVVGLPRSGSSFLAHVISHLDDWFIFDDLYLYREAQAINAINAPLNAKQLEKLLFFLGWQIRARIKFGVFCVPKMALDDVDKMNSALIETYKNTPVFWYELQEEWMTRLALNQGAKYWGYKAPQDFQLIDTLNKAYPNIKIIFLYRDPRKMLRSFKFVRDQDGSPEQYHPIIYSYYWKKALQTLNMLIKKTPSRVLPIKYEELAKYPEEQAKRIASFLGTSVSKPIEISQNNSSFSSPEKQELTPTEIKICESITHEGLNDYGYDTNLGQLRLRDIPDLVRTSFTFAFHQLKRLILNKSARVSIKMYLKGLFMK